MQLSSREPQPLKWQNELHGSIYTSHALLGTELAMANLTLSLLKHRMVKIKLLKSISFLFSKLLEGAAGT